MTATTDLLRDLRPPWLLQTTDEASRVLANFGAAAAPPNLRVFTFKGERCTRWESFYRECWDVIRPPQYFGENLYALKDVLTDQDVVGLDPVLIIVLNATRLLSHEASDDREALLRCLEHCGEFCSAPEGQLTGPPRPFHTLLHLDGPVPAQLHAYPRMELVQ
ncbi:MAG TPA: barstar family protein [Phenylobacterium sp.]